MIFSQVIFGDGDVSTIIAFIFFQDRHRVATALDQFYLFDLKPVTAVLADQFVAILYVITSARVITDLAGVEGGADGTVISLNCNDLHVGVSGFVRVELGGLGDFGFEDLQIGTCGNSSRVGTKSGVSNEYPSY